MTEELPRDSDGQLSRYAWPGGYPLYYLCAEMDYTMCPTCANKADKDPDADPDNWKPASCGINWEDPELFCDDCGQRIESAYAEPD